MRKLRVLLLAAGLTCALQAAAVPAPQIIVLSNRADLISGGDALVEIKWPAGTNLALAKIAVGSTNVKSAFALRPNGRYMGLVSGLQRRAQHPHGARPRGGFADHDHQPPARRAGVCRYPAEALDLRDQGRHPRQRGRQPGKHAGDGAGNDQGERPRRRPGRRPVRHATDVHLLLSADRTAGQQLHLHDHRGECLLHRLRPGGASGGRDDRQLHERSR